MSTAGFRRYDEARPHLNRKEKRVSESTGKVPSGASIGFMMLFWLASCIVTFWLAWGAETGREIVGVVLGFLLAFVLLGQWLGRLARRGAAVLAEREKALEDAAGESLTQYKPGPY